MLVIVFGGGYLLIVVIMCLLERQLVFAAVTAAERWQNPPDPAIQDVELTAADGNRIHGWWLADPDSSSALLLCHGNYGNVSDRGQSLVRLRGLLHCSVLIFDYPGYGKSTGKPSEEGCYAAAECALAWLESAKHIPPGQVLLYGESLGGGVAVEMALRHPPRCLMLAKTFTSAPAVAARMYRWLPVRVLMRTRFDNLSKIASCRCPVYITSATSDTVVPYEHGEELYRSAPDPKSFFRLEGQDHSDRLPDECFTELLRFMEHAAGKRPGG
jgi:fermentation-respiration switch protein FrsA (DUF1100 family)